MLTLDLTRRLRTAPLWLTYPTCLTLAALAACSSVPLGPLPAPRPVPIASPPPPPSSQPSLQQPEQPPAAQAFPVAPPSAAVPTAPDDSPQPVTDVAPPYGPAVAARFPDPPVNYQTPAFAPGHAGFTSNAELHALLVQLAGSGSQRADAPQVRLLALGTSQAGAPLEALHFSRREPGLSPLAGVTGRTDKPARPTVLLVGQQHGDEPAGAEALLVVAQELAHGRFAALLDRIDVVVLPRANPDGAETQRRTAANGIDINRDHLLLRTPEAQAQAQLVREFAPVVVVDAHEYRVVGGYLEKFGAVQRFDALLQYAMTANMPEFTVKAAEQWFREPAVARLKNEGLASEWYYTTSADVNDKKVSMGGTLPDTGRNVNGLTNAISLLVETRGVGLGRLHLKRRVHTHVTAIASILQSAASRAPDLVKLRQFVDQEVSSKACQGELVVEVAPTPSEYRLLMLDPATGADKPVVVTWDSALQLTPVKVRPRPCGYWLAEAEADAVQHLRALGVRVARLEEGGEVRGEAYRETSREAVRRPDPQGSVAPAAGDASDTLRVKVQLVPALLDLRAGGYYVPLDQPLGNLVAAALEPDTEISFFANRIVSAMAGEGRVLLRPEMRMAPMP